MVSRNNDIKNETRKDSQIVTERHLAFRVNDAFYKGGKANKAICQNWKEYR